MRFALTTAALAIACVSPGPLHTGQSSTDSTVVPFTIDIPDAVLADLRTRIDETRFPDEILNSDWDYGTNMVYLKELVEYWRHEFDWRAQERRLNEFDQFTTNIDGLDVHFIHQRSPHEDAMPLLLPGGESLLGR